MGADAAVEDSPDGLDSQKTKVSEVVDEGTEEMSDVAGDNNRIRCRARGE